jgi:hypothetical protein
MSKRYVHCYVTITVVANVSTEMFRRLLQYIQRSLKYYKFHTFLILMSYAFTSIFACNSIPLNSCSSNNSGIVHISLDILLTNKASNDYSQLKFISSIDCTEITVRNGLEFIACHSLYDALCILRLPNVDGRVIELWVGKDLEGGETSQLRLNGCRDSYQAAFSYKPGVLQLRMHELPLY